MTGYVLIVKMVATETATSESWENVATFSGPLSQNSSAHLGEFECRLLHALDDRNLPQVVSNILRKDVTTIKKELTDRFKKHIGGKFTKGSIDSGFDVKLFTTLGFY